MSLLISIPIRNHQTRIEPLIKSIEVLLKKEAQSVLFLNENSTDESAKTLQYIINQYDIPSYEIINTNNSSRINSFRLTLEKAKNSNVDYIMIMHEGWEDNIYEFVNIVRSKEYENYDSMIACRSPQELSLGTIYNFLSNRLSSIVLSSDIKETKCDSINIYKTKYIPKDITTYKIEGLFSFRLLCHYLTRGKVKFSDVDFGLNYRSQVKLNTKRFLGLIYLLISLRFN